MPNIDKRQQASSDHVTGGQSYRDQHSSKSLQKETTSRVSVESVPHHRSGQLLQQQVSFSNHSFLHSRFSSTLMKRFRGMLLYAKLEKQLWAEAAVTAHYINN